jgi:hypothetical protein
MAVAYGDLVRPDRCLRCRNTGRIEAHHYLGYEKHQRFCIEWLCKPCHQSHHNTGPAAYWNRRHPKGINRRSVVASILYNRKRPWSFLTSPRPLS